MMGKLTAAQALDIARSKDPSGIVDQILERVRVAAEKGEYSIKVRDFGFSSGSWYDGSGTAEGKAVIAELKKLGFNADIGAECLQFVDLWLEVSWKEPTHD